MENDRVRQMIEKIKKFRDERDWLKFHDPKSMAVSITIEAAELLEHFQWKSKEEIEEYIKTHQTHIAEEIADVGMYLFELADNLGLDLIEIMEKKLKMNAEKYPVDKAKGSAKKYDEL